MARRHFEAVVHRKDGSFVLASSALTGRTWDGTLWVFSSMQDFDQCPNLDMVATRTTAGITDVLWLLDEANFLLSSDSGELELWNCHPPGHTLEHKTSLGSHDDMALTVGLLAGGQKAVSGGADRRIILWDIENAKSIISHRGHSDTVSSIATHPSSENCFISTSQDGSVRLWDLKKPRKPASKFAACNNILHTCVRWCSTKEDSVALGSETGQVEVFDLRWTGSLLMTYQPHCRAIHRLAFAPWDSGLLASVSDDATVWTQSLNNRKKVLSNSAHVDFVHGLSWHPTEPYLVTCSWDGQVLQHSVDISSSEGDVTVTRIDVVEERTELKQAKTGTQMEQEQEKEHNS